MNNSEILKIAQKILNKDIYFAAKVIRMIEDHDPNAQKILEYLYQHKGNAYILGITGLPGSGKSTIVNLLIRYFRSKNKSVGVIAVDPSSPLTNGAILGDRVRMVEHSKDSNVFIKSIATRGHYGGLARSTLGVLSVMEAMGKDIVIIETVGVGQTEVSIMNLAHTTVLVLVPELGDYIQTIKAGILEIGDIFVINKIDKKDPFELSYNIESLIQLKDMDVNEVIWKPKVILTSTLQEKGIETLVNTIEEHKKFFELFNKEKYLKKRFNEELRNEVFNYFIDFFEFNFKKSILIEEVVKNIIKNKLNPYTESKNIIKKLLILLKEHNLNEWKKIKNKRNT